MAPDDLDQDEAAATYYTANCLVHGMVDFALFAASRATDHIGTRPIDGKTSGSPTNEHIVHTIPV